METPLPRLQNWGLGTNIAAAIWSEGILDRTVPALGHLASGVTPCTHDPQQHQDVIICYPPRVIGRKQIKHDLAMLIFNAAYFNLNRIKWNKVSMHLVNILILCCGCIVIPHRPSERDENESLQLLEKSEGNERNTEHLVKTCWISWISLSLFRIQNGESWGSWE